MLHNYPWEKIPLQYLSPVSFDCENIENGSIQNREWRNNLENLQPIRVSASKNYTTDAKKIRDDEKTYKDYKNIFSKLIKKSKKKKNLHKKVTKMSRKYQEIMANSERNIR